MKTRAYRNCFTRWTKIILLSKQIQSWKIVSCLTLKPKPIRAWRDFNYFQYEMTLSTIDENICHFASTWRWDQTLDGHWHKTSCKNDQISISDVASGLHTCFEKKRISGTLNTTCWEHTILSKSIPELLNLRQIYMKWTKHCHKSLELSWVFIHFLLPSATSQAFFSCWWYDFLVSLSLSIFSRARVRNIFCVLVFSYMAYV